MRRCALVPGVLLVGMVTAPAQEPDFSKVEIKTTQIADQLYLLQGAGSNMTASAGTDGILLVDTEYAPLAEKIRSALQGLAGSDKPARYVLNTHYHPDHIGADSAFAQAGATVIATDEVRARMAKGGTAGNGGSLSREMQAAEPNALPAITFSHDLTVHMNGENIHAVHYLHAHTDGDTVVFFPRAHAVAMGDIYVRYGFPFIDVNSGGTVGGMIKACEDVLASVPSDAKVVPGHGELAGVADLREYLKMLNDTSAAVAKALKGGKTLEQMKKEQLLGAWSERYSPPGAFVDTDAFTESLYYSLVRYTLKRGRAPR